MNTILLMKEMNLLQDQPLLELLIKFIFNYKREKNHSKHLY